MLQKNAARQAWQIKTKQNKYNTITHAHRYLEKKHTHPFNGPFSGTTQVSRYQKGKTNLDFTEARDSERQWHQLGHMQVCISLQTDSHASTTPLKVFLQAGCPSCRPTNSVKALKAVPRKTWNIIAILCVSGISFYCNMFSHYWHSSLLQMTFEHWLSEG